MYAELQGTPESFEAAKAALIGDTAYYGHYYNKKPHVATGVGEMTHPGWYMAEDGSAVGWCTSNGNKLLIDARGVITVAGRRHGIPWGVLTDVEDLLTLPVLKIKSREHWHPAETRDDYV